MRETNPKVKKLSPGGVLSCVLYGIGHAPLLYIGAGSLLTPLGRTPFKGHEGYKG